MKIAEGLEKLNLTPKMIRDMVKEITTAEAMTNPDASAKKQEKLVELAKNKPVEDFLRTDPVIQELRAADPLLDKLIGGIVGNRSR